MQLFACTNAHGQRKSFKKSGNIRWKSEPFQISIEIGSEEIIPLAPFNLKYPLDSTHIHINAETLLDTLVIDWETSFNLYGIETNYEIDFEYNEESDKEDIEVDHSQLLNTVINVKVEYIRRIYEKNSYMG